MWEAVLSRFEEQAPGSVMGRLVLERALPSDWVNEVFESHRQRQYSRELLFSTIVELMTSVTFGLSPSLHAAARKLDNLPVSLAALYDKIRRTEPGVMRGLVRGSAQRLSGVGAWLNQPDSLPGWQLRIVDGNHLPGSQKRLKVLRSHSGAALPGHSLVVYDPDQGMVCDLIACEDAYKSERESMLPLIDSATTGQLWLADRHFCTRTITQGLSQAGAHFLIRQHTHHPRLLKQGEWSEYQSCGTGLVREQTICVRAIHDPDSPDQVWRRIGIKLNTPTESGETTLMLWTNLPMTIDALTVAALYRKRWRIEGMFGRLESVMHSEISSLGHPGAALLAFTVAVLGYNIISLLQRVVQQAFPQEPPHWEVSSYHLAQHIKYGYEGMLIALPAELWHGMAGDSDQEFVRRLLSLARRISPKQVATNKRKTKTDSTKSYVDGTLARSHISTARVLRQARATTP